MNNMKNGLFSILILSIIVMMLCVMLQGCTTTKYIPVKEVHTDTVYKARKDSVHLVTVRNIIDSIRWKDSTAVTLNDKGQVVLKEIYHYRDHVYIHSDSLLYYKNLFDSLKSCKIDSIPKPYPVTKYVEKSLSWWEKTVMKIGYISIVIILVIIAFYALKNKLKIITFITKLFHLIR